MTTFGSAHQFLAAAIGKRQITDANDLPNKTIARTHDADGEALLVFLDDTFVIFETREYGDEIAIKSDLPNIVVLLRAHLIDEATYRHHEMLQEAHLRAIFEGGANGG